MSEELKKLLACWLDAIERCLGLARRRRPQCQVLRRLQLPATSPFPHVVPHFTVAATTSTPKPVPTIRSQSTRGCRDVRHTDSWRNDRTSQSVLPRAFLPFGDCLRTSHMSATVSPFSLLRRPGSTQPTTRRAGS